MNKAEQIEEAIEVLGLQVKALNDELKTLEFEEDKEAYEFDISIKSLAIEALQQSLEREKNEPLTLEQLEGDMFHEYVWCSRTKAWGYVESKKRGEEYVPIIKFFWGWEWLEDCEEVYKYKKESD